MEHYIRQYMAEDWESISVLGEYSRGLEAVLELVNTTLTAFPDLKLHILDIFCVGEDQKYFKIVCPPEVVMLLCKDP